MLKKIISVFLIAITLVVSSPLPVFAQSEPTVGKWYAPSYGEFVEKVNGADDSDIFGERYTQAQVFWIFYSIPALLVGNEMLGCAAGNSVEDEDGTRALMECMDRLTQLGNAGPMLQLARITESFARTRPASGIAYIVQTAKNIHIIPEAYAQGFGYDTLAPFQRLWVASRNMAYGLIVLVMVAFALMIMLRVKLSPQVVISVQSALPRIALALVFITFSYAIIGLLVDLSYVVQGIFSVFMYSSGMFGVTPTGSSVASPENPIVLLNQINSWPVGIMAFGFYLVILIIAFGAITVQLVPTGIGALIGAGGTILAVLLLLVFMYALIRIFWLFLITYTRLIISIILAPFQILIGATLPGGSMTSWIKGVVAQLAVFVTATLLILIAHLIFWSSQPGPSGVAWAPGNIFQTWLLVNPFGVKTGAFGANSAQFPGFGNAIFDISVIGFFAGYALLLSIPKLASAVRDQILTGRGQFGLGIGEAFGPVGGLATSTYDAGKKAFGAGVVGYANRRFLGLTGGRKEGTTPLESGDLPPRAKIKREE